MRFGLDKGLASRMYARVSIAEAQEPLRTVRVPFTVAIPIAVLHARRAYTAGTPVTTNMFYTKEINAIECLHSVVYPDDDSFWCDGYLQPYMPISRFLPGCLSGNRRSLPVRTILVAVRVDDVLLRLSAEVLQPGFIGDKIRVRLQPTKKIVLVHIISAGVYEVQ